MTPDKVFVAASATNYGVDDLSSGDETDDDEKPRKTVPKWAAEPYVSRRIGVTEGKRGREETGEIVAVTS